MVQGGSWTSLQSLLTWHSGKGEGAGHVLVRGVVKNWEGSETLPYLQANELDPPLFQRFWKKHQNSWDRADGQFMSHSNSSNFNVSISCDSCPSPSPVGQHEEHLKTTERSGRKPTLSKWKVNTPALCSRGRQYLYLLRPFSIQIPLKGSPAQRTISTLPTRCAEMPETHGELSPAREKQATSWVM